MASPPNHSAAHGAFQPMPRTDDCWRRIGVAGDHSCERLAALGHCRHCPHYARAAAAWLDSRVVDIAPPVDHGGGADEAGAQGAAVATTASLVIFRVGPEWLALPSVSLTEIARLSTVHSLPHQRNPAVLGIVSLRGSLLVCVSLARLLHLEQSDDGGQSDTTVHRSPRMLIFGSGGDAVALPVDEVAAASRLPLSAMRPLPSTVERAAGHLTEALLIHRDRTVGLLDPVRLRQALQRSLA